MTRWFGYESQQATLGKRFVTTVQDALNRIEFNLELYPIVENDVRRCMTNTFPYGILFHVRSDMLQILAVMHLHLKPNYWNNKSFEPF